MFLIPLLMLLTAQELPVYDCVVTEKTKTSITLTCEDRDMYRFTAKEWADTEQWPTNPALGQLVKANRNGSRMVPVANCVERLNAAIREYCGGLDCKYPVNSLMPEDCSRPTPRFIEQLLKKHSVQPR